MRTRTWTVAGLAIVLTAGVAAVAQEPPADRRDGLAPRPHIEINGLPGNRVGITTRGMGEDRLVIVEPLPDGSLRIAGDDDKGVEAKKIVQLMIDPEFVQERQGRSTWVLPPTRARQPRSVKPTPAVVDDFIEVGTGHIFRRSRIQHIQFGSRGEAEVYLIGHKETVRLSPEDAKTLRAAIMPSRDGVESPSPRSAPPERTDPNRLVPPEPRPEPLRPFDVDPPSLHPGLTPPSRSQPSSDGPPSAGNPQ